MKVVRYQATKKVQNGEHCVVSEYPLDDRAINGAYVELTGREPDEGRVVNTVCKELAYVISGSGSIEIEGSEIFLEAGDIVLIEPGERFFWSGTMKLFLPCHPAWYPEQYQKVSQCAVII